MEPLEKKPNFVKGLRCTYNYSAKQIAQKLEISDSTYRKKEAGIIGFSDNEKITIAKLFGLSMEQVNRIFFDGQFPSGNKDIPDGSTTPPFVP